MALIYFNRSIIPAVGLRGLIERIREEHQQRTGQQKVRRKSGREGQLLKHKQLIDPDPEPGSTDGMWREQPQTRTAALWTSGTILLLFSGEENLFCKDPVMCPKIDLTL